jgi:hypothetical protein
MILIKKSPVHGRTSVIEKPELPSESGTGKKWIFVNRALSGALTLGPRAGPIL